jgi:hypothetical protein
MSDAGDLAMLIASEVPIVVIESHDERRVLALLAEIALREGMTVMEWTAVRGLERGALERRPPKERPETAEPERALVEAAHRPGPALWVFCDLHPFLKDDPRLVRLMREVALDFPALRNTLVLVSHRLTLPPELARLSARFELRLPDDATLMAIVREQAEAWAKANRGARVRTDRGTLDALIANLRGVTEADARMLIRHAIFTDGAITDSDLPEVNRLKFELLDAEGVLHFEYDAPDLSALAGLAGLKRWLETRRGLLTGTVTDVDRPRGLMLLGVQGGGKSLAARCIAGEMGLPLLRLDFGNLYNKFVGETERNLRESLAQADAEQRAPVFVVATANDIRALPPELLRKGRLDEIFFVDLPGALARRDILDLHLRAREIDPSEIDLDGLAAAAEGFTGAELEAAVVSARYRAAGEGGSMDTAALHEAIASAVPLSVTMAEQIAALRAWAKERTVPAD